MEFKSSVLFMVCAMYASDAFPVTRRLSTERLKEKPLLCSINDLSRTARAWRFPAQLTCNGDEVIDIFSNEALRGVNVGTECTYSYSCPLDTSLNLQNSLLVCDRTGKWSGEVPLCNSDDSLFTRIIELFQGKARTTDTDVEVERPAAQLENDAVEEPMSNASATLQSQDLEARKSNFNMEDAELYDVFCNETKICLNVSSVEQCNNLTVVGVSDRFSAPGLQMAFIKVCRHCVKNYCENPFILI